MDDDQNETNSIGIAVRHSGAGRRSHQIPSSGAIYKIMAIGPKMMRMTGHALPAPKRLGAMFFF